MDPSQHLAALRALSGFVIGGLVGLTGVGGGSLMTPVLVLVFGVPGVTAVGTDLLYAAATKTGGIVVHGLRHTVAWHVTGRLALGSVPAAVLTLSVVRRLDVSGAGAAAAISMVLGATLLLTAATLLVPRRVVAALAARRGPPDPRRTAQLTVLTGAVLGVLVSLTSVGAGAIGVTALTLLYPDMATRRIVGSDVAHAVPLTLVAGVGHWMLGTIDWALLGALLTGSLPGVVLGSYAAGRVPERVLRPLLAAVLVLVGVRLLA